MLKRYALSFRQWQDPVDEHSSSRNSFHRVPKSNRPFDAHVKPIISILLACTSLILWKSLLYFAQKKSLKINFPNKYFPNKYISAQINKLYTLLSLMPNGSVYLCSCDEPPDIATSHLGMVCVNSKLQSYLPYISGEIYLCLTFTVELDNGVFKLYFNPQPISSSSLKQKG